MKTSLLVILVCTTFTQGAWQNALKPAGKAGPELKLVENGQAVYQIAIPASPTTKEQKAAEDLAHWIKEMTGGEMKVTAKAPAPVISISTDNNFADEEYSIAIDGQNLALVGGPGRGAINAVYALLEEDIGCRWYTGDEATLPKNPTLAVAPVARRYRPQLRVRDPFYQCAFHATWSLRNRTNAQGAIVPEEFGGMIDYGPLFVHTHALLLPPDKYFKEHPEYFALNPAGKRTPVQLCPTEPAVAKIVTDAVLDRLKKQPTIEIISISKNDTQDECHCDRCKKNREAEGSEMANQLVLVNAVAEAVEKEYPKVVIDTLAYLDTMPVPKTARPRKNVVIRLCNDAVGAWVHPFTPARDCDIAPMIKKWSAVCDRIYIWDYAANFSHWLAPMPNLNVMDDNLHFWVENHAEGVMFQGAYQGPGERDQLRCWVMAKLLWDPSRDRNALVADFIAGYFGAAAEPIARYRDLLVENAKKHAKDLASPPGGIRYEMTNPFFSREFLDGTKKNFDEAEKLAVSDPGLLKKVEREELPVLYVRLSQKPDAPTLDKFERIARAEKIIYLEEAGANFEPKVAVWRKQIETEKTMHKTISHGDATGTYQAFPDACRLKNGDILAVFYAGYGHVSIPTDDFPKGGRICITRSSDEGKTWSPPQVLFDDDDDNRDSHVAQLDDGSIVVTFFSWRLKGNRLKSHKDFDGKTWRQNAEPVGAQMVRSTDGGKTWDTTAQSIFPDWFCSAPVRQMPDGTCLLGLYGKELVEKISFPGVTRSRDRGKTWEPPVKIPLPPGLSLDAETDLIRLKDGSLFAALRSSNLNMHFSTSSDEGQTWSIAKDIGFKGHAPHLYRLNSGEILLTHRVPNTSLHVSRDECKTWSGPYEIDSVIGAYPSTVELKDGSFLIVYYTEGQGSEIRAKRFKLKPDGIEPLAF